MRCSFGTNIPQARERASPKHGGRVVIEGCAKVFAEGPSKPKGLSRAKGTKLEDVLAQRGEQKKKGWHRY